jgi:predicted GH43/DUF377 family glycosyl hydrolase
MLKEKRTKGFNMDRITFEKHPNNPIPSLGIIPGSWREDATMTVDIIDRGDHWQAFYVGKMDKKDGIGIATTPKEGFDGTGWEDDPRNPIIVPGIPGSFDSEHCVDPACIVWESKYYLYYSALGDGPDSLGLAISDDGLNFVKLEQPVMVGRAPEVVVMDGLMYMFYSMDNPKGGYEFHLATSSDGLSFTEEGPIFRPSDEGWDSMSLVTPRIFLEDGMYIMSYAGDAEEKDFPTHFGFAFSKDLRNWKRYPHNPVFRGGDEGSWESRAIWYPEILKVDGVYYMWYEGYNGAESQVGLATTNAPLAKIGHQVLQEA